MRRVFVALVVLSSLPIPASAQGRPEIRLERANGDFTGIPVRLEAGFAAVPLALLRDLGWTVAEDHSVISLSAAGEIEISLRLRSPFFRWDGVALQLTDAPYVVDGETFVPLQLLTDFFTRRLPDLYDFDGPNSTLRAGDPALRGGEVESESEVGARVDDPASPEVTLPRVRRGAAPYDGVRVVVIDAGHGGADPGAIGPGGIREKTVALGIAMHVADILGGQAQLEVRMTRDDDTFVDLWERGERATDMKGERPGVFVSIHANSFPGRRTATGFETYFLSEARTEHERRVAAIENAPVSFRGQDVDVEREPDLGFILRDLNNSDYQHQSAILAQIVQDELDAFHPGPNRGVKQGVLAVLTNALMPSVLVEVGYLSNEEEGRLLGELSFQRDAAEAIARAVVRFFQGYPPGGGFGGSEGRR